MHSKNYLKWQETFPFIKQMVLKLRNMCKICEKLVHVATISGKFQYIEYLKPSFLEALK